jgi:hypothetical protein
MDVLYDALHCRWGSFVAYLAIAVTGGLGFYIFCFIAVFIGAILRTRNNIQFHNALDDAIGFRQQGFMRDSRNLQLINHQTPIVTFQIQSLIKKKSFLTITIAAALVCVTITASTGGACNVSSNPRADQNIVISTDRMTPNQGITETTDLPSQTAQNGVTQLLSEVRAKHINVRQNPTTNAEIVTTLNKGDIVQIIGRNQQDTWVVVQLQSQVGWIRRDLLTLTESDLSGLTVY